MAERHGEGGGLAVARSREPARLRSELPVFAGGGGSIEVASVGELGPLRSSFWAMFLVMLGAFVVADSLSPLMAGLCILGLVGAASIQGLVGGVHRASLVQAVELPALEAAGGPYRQGEAERVLVVRRRSWLFADEQRVRVADIEAVGFWDCGTFGVWSRERRMIGRAALDSADEGELPKVPAIVHRGGVIPLGETLPPAEQRALVEELQALVTAAGGSTLRVQFQPVAEDTEPKA